MASCAVTRCPRGVAPLLATLRGKLVSSRPGAVQAAAAANGGGHDSDGDADVGAIRDGRAS